jgi:hypothetical protein
MLPKGRASPELLEILSVASVNNSSNVSFNIISILIDLIKIGSSEHFIERIYVTVCSGNREHSAKRIQVGETATITITVGSLRA